MKRLSNRLTQDFCISPYVFPSLARAGDQSLNDSRWPGEAGYLFIRITCGRHAAATDICVGSLN